MKASYNSFLEAYGRSFMDVHGSFMEVSWVFMDVHGRSLKLKFRKGSMEVHGRSSTFMIFMED